MTRARFHAHPKRTDLVLFCTLAIATKAVVVPQPERNADKQKDCDADDRAHDYISFPVLLVSYYTRAQEPVNC